MRAHKRVISGGHCKVGKCYFIGNHMGCNQLKLNLGSRKSKLMKVIMLERCETNVQKAIFMLHNS